MGRDIIDTGSVGLKSGGSVKPEAISSFWVENAGSGPGNGGFPGDEGGGMAWCGVVGWRDAGDKTGTIMGLHPVRVPEVTKMPHSIHGLCAH